MKLIYFLSFFCVISLELHSQTLEVVSSSGSTSSNESFQVEWTLGEVVSSSSNRNFQEGFIQTFHIDEVITSINKDFYNSIKAYPNPTDDIIYIDNINENIQTELILYDVIGNVLLDQVIDGKESIMLDLSHFKTGNYLLFISNKNSNQSYKIVKQ